MSASNITKNAKNFLAENKVFTPPVDIESLASKQGVLIRYEELEDDISGLLIYKNKKAIIVVNSNHHKNRRRFTISHELAHYILHTKECDDMFVDRKPFVMHRDKRASSGEYQKEIEANQWAAEILMPEDMIENDIDDLEIDLFDEIEVSKLAKKYQVSEQAFSFRLANLGYSII